MHALAVTSTIGGILRVAYIRSWHNGDAVHTAKISLEEGRPDIGSRYCFGRSRQSATGE